MSKITDDLANLLKVYNPYDFAKLGKAKIYVIYNPEIRGRAGEFSRYQVVGIGFKTDTVAAWYEHGSMTFYVWSRDEKAKVKDEAMKWATDTYGIKEWAKMPFRESWVAREAYDLVMAELKKAKEQDNG